MAMEEGNELVYIVMMNKYQYIYEHSAKTCPSIPTIFSPVGFMHVSEPSIINHKKVTNSLVSAAEAYSPDCACRIECHTPVIADISSRLLLSTPRVAFTMQVRNRKSAVGPSLPSGID